MNCRVTYNVRAECDRTTTPLNSSFGHARTLTATDWQRQNCNRNEQLRIKGSRNPPITIQHNKHLHEQPRQQLRNAEKLMHFEQMKASNIDDLNFKIQKMISRLSDQVSPCESLVSRGSKQRIKTDYSDMCLTHFESEQHDSQLSFDHLMTREQRRMMVDSQVIKQSQVFQEKRHNEYPHSQNADAIRRKYKAGPGRTKQNKQEKSTSTLSNFSHAEAAPISHFDADLIRFRQKLKVNNEKERRQMSRQLNFPVTASTEKPAKLKHKRNIEEELRKYEKRLNTYDSKKLLGLANEGQIERVPLGDRTNNNSYLKYSPYTNKQSNFKLKLKQEEMPSFQPYEEEQTEEPLTADFRQPSGKNELKLLLKNLASQIALDQQFRNCKKWFQRLSGEHKWQQLGREVANSGLDLDQTAIREIFSLKEEEENPFYTPRDDGADCKQLVELFVRCEEHWFDNIVKKYNRERLLGNGFRQSKLDIAAKGYLEIQDFVRFLNLEIDLQVRNRDLLIIFQRLRSEDHLTFQELLEVISE